MRTIVIAVLLALTIVGPVAAASEPEPQSREASLRFVSQFQSQALVGISYGITNVDNQMLILDQRVNARIASGLRTIQYSCPSETQMPGGSRLSFNFQAGQMYELVCRTGQQAEIRAAGC